MTAIPTLIVNLPETAGTALHWWLVDDHEIIKQGCDSDPLLAADLKLNAVAGDPLQQVALVPAAAAVIRTHELLPDATDKQALAAARLAAGEQSLGTANLHIVSALGPDEQIMSATMDTALLAQGLVALQQAGIDPDLILPAALLVPPPENGAIAADFGFDAVLRSPHFAGPDEPVMRQMLDADPQPLSDEDTADALAHAADHAMLNLRSGSFAKAVRQRMTAPQRRLLLWLAAAALILSLLIPAVQLVRYHLAISTLEAQALTAATAVVGEVEDLEQAERLLDDRLIRENRGNVVFSVPASALFSALQQTPGVSAERIGYRPDGTLFAGLTAVRNEDINPLLLTLQQNGFVITATPRTDATGAAKADITVRAP